MIILRRKNYAITPAVTSGAANAVANAGKSMSLAKKIGYGTAGVLGLAAIPVASKAMDIIDYRSGGFLE